MGGASGDGVVYALNEKTGSETTIFSFNGTNGAGPNALTVTQDGIIYATS
jgi:outer membrane protein assembly factor BamB